MRKLRVCAVAAIAGAAFSSSALAVGDAFLIDLRASGTFNRLIRFPANAPALNVLSTTGTYRGFAIDFDNFATALYGITNPGNVFGTISTTNGNFTAIAPISGAGAGETNWSGLSSHPDGTFYASSSAGVGNSRLYTVNPVTGATTLVGNMGAGFTNIDIAIDRNGLMYGHDISGNRLLSIDINTGAATVIGPTGITSSFAQGMDFDWDTNILYASQYTGGGVGNYGTFNLATGAFTSIMSTTAWNIEAEMAINSPIPEPAALSLLALGGLALVRRRR